MRYVFLFAAFVPAITVHEYFHALIAYRFGDDTARREGRLTLNPLAHLDPIGTITIFLIGFGWGRPVPVNPSRYRHPRADLWVSFAGPLSNLGLAIIFGLLLRLLPAYSDINLSIQILAPVRLLCVISLQLNLVLFFFNLIPLYPLDGSHVLENLLPLNQAYKFRAFSQRYGMNLLFGLILLGWLTHWDVFSRVLMPPVAYFSRLLSGM